MLHYMEDLRAADLTKAMASMDAQITQPAELTGDEVMCLQC